MIKVSLSAQCFRETFDADFNTITVISEEKIELTIILIFLKLKRKEKSILLKMDCFIPFHAVWDDPYDMGHMIWLIWYDSYLALGIPEGTGQKGAS